MPPKRGQIQTPLKKYAYFHVKTRVFTDITGILWMQKNTIRGIYDGLQTFSDMPGSI